MSKLPVILIVDDDEMNIVMAKSILEMKVRAEILTTTSGSACLGILRQRQKPVDLILLDIAMPGMDGLQTLAAIRNDPSLRDSKVIFLTAAADKEIKSLAKIGKKYGFRKENEFETYMEEK